MIVETKYDYFVLTINLGFKLHKAAHDKTISSILCNRVIGITDFKIRKVLIRLIARSTCILRLATSLVVSVSFFVN